MTQKELVVEYIKEFESILPAKMQGEVYKDIMFGSETSKRCRELRKEGVLKSKKAGRFEVFFLAETDLSFFDGPKEVKEEKAEFGNSKQIYEMRKK